MKVFISFFLMASFVAVEASSVCGTLISAIELEETSCIERLAKAGEDLNKPLATPTDRMTNWGTSLSPLGYAARLGNIKAISALVKNGADVNGQDNYGHSAIAVAAFYKQIDSIKVLHSIGAVLNYNNCKYGDYYRECYTPLAMALNRPSGLTRRTVETLLTLGASPNLLAQGDLPLALATIDLYLVDLMIAHGAYVNLRNNVGRTALFSCFSADCVEKLISLGAFANIYDQDDCSAVDFAIPSNDAKVVLLKHGAKPGINCPLN